MTAPVPSSIITHVKIKGFALIEAVMAAFILAISLFAVGTAVYSQFSALNQNREKAIATLAAQEEIENIRGMSYDAILGLGSSFTASGFEYLKNPAGAVAVDNIYGTSDIRRISVTVSWASIMGQRLEKKLATLVTRNGINKQ